jgi:hypothetical protein
LLLLVCRLDSTGTHPRRKTGAFVVVVGAVSFANELCPFSANYCLDFPFPAADIWRSMQPVVAGLRDAHTLDQHGAALQRLGNGKCVRMLDLGTVCDFTVHAQVVSGLADSADGFALPNVWFLWLRVQGVVTDPFDPLPLSTEYQPVCQ